jgi:hypothetical protein
MTLVYRSVKGSALTSEEADGNITHLDTNKQNLSGKDATGGYAGLTLFKINFKNALNTFTSFFTNSNTAARTYTFQNRDGTIADDTDLALKLAKATVPCEFIIACSDETTALTTGTAKVTFRAPYAFTITAVRASVTTAPTGAALVVDINESGTTILSTKLSIDASEKTSTTAATPAAISDASIADDSEITIDIDTVGSTIAGAGLKVYIIGTHSV